MITVNPAHLQEAKQMIAEDTDCGGMFTCHQYIDDSSFVDFIFVSEYEGQEVVWNAVMTTARGDYYELVHSTALDEAIERYPYPEGYDPFHAVPCEYDDEGNPTMYRMVLLPEFEDYERIKYEWISQRTLEILNSKTVSIPANRVEIDTDYEWGTGLHIRIDKQFINEEDVYNFIEQFRESPEDLLHPKDPGVICLSADELGVALSDDGRFVIWTNGFCNSVAIKMPVDEII